MAKPKKTPDYVFKFEVVVVMDVPDGEDLIAEGDAICDSIRQGLAFYKNIRVTFTQNARQ